MMLALYGQLSGSDVLIYIITCKARFFLGGGMNIKYVF